MRRRVVRAFLSRDAVEEVHEPDGALAEQHLDHVVHLGLPPPAVHHRVEVGLVRHRVDLEDGARVGLVVVVGADGAGGQHVVDEVHELALHLAGLGWAEQALDVHKTFLLKLAAQLQV